MTNQEYIKKKELIHDLFMEVDDILVSKFFDTESDELLDKKIEVLTALKKGVPPGEIPEYYKVLELMPSNGIWD